MSKICINCGMKLEENAVFCDECGTKQPDSQSAQQTSLPVQPQTTHQPNYGQAVSNNLQSQPINETSNIIKNSGIGIAAFVLGIIAVCTFGCLIIPDILGLIFAIIALAEKNTKKTLAIVGLIMCIISFFLLIIILAL